MIKILFRLVVKRFYFILINFTALGINIMFFLYGL